MFWFYVTTQKRCPTSIAHHFGKQSKGHLMKTIQGHQNANLKAMENHVNTRLALCTGGSVEGAATTAIGSTFGYGQVCTDTGRQALAHTARRCSRGGRGRGRECRDPRIHLGAAPQYLAGMIAAGQIMTVVGSQASLGGHWRTGMMLLRFKGASICLAGGSKPSQRCSCNQ